MCLGGVPLVVPRWELRGGSSNKITDDIVENHFTKYRICLTLRWYEKSPLWSLLSNYNAAESTDCFEEVNCDIQGLDP